ncbi:MAG: fused MFS/spermidine synthase [Polyangiaceae bacterium]
MTAGTVALEARAPSGADRRFSALYVLFVLSGAAGLIDQLCFSKYLTHIVGSTAYAVSAVLASFMAGLAFGAQLGGRYFKGVRPLVMYGVLEVIVAVTVALSPTAFHALTPLYVDVAQRVPDSLLALSVARWCLAMVVVLIPTTAMGATLPLLSRLLGESASATVDEQRAREKKLTRLYTANTLGGAVGAVGAAYAVLPWLGLSGTVSAAAALSLLVGLGALLLHRAAPLQETARKRSETGAAVSAPLVDRELVLLWVLAACSGFVVFACEVIFTHLLALVIGNSAYAFGLILAVFLACLALGASLAARAQARFGSAALPLSLCASALALSITLPLWDRLPILFAGTGKVLTTFAAREALRAVVAWLILFVPVTAMGLTFPLILARVAGGTDLGRWVGRLTSINTVGAVAGSLATGYLLLPAFGAQRALAAVATVFAVLAAWATHVSARSRGRQVWSGVGIVFLVLTLSPRWDLTRLTAGTNVYFDGPQPAEAVLMIREDVHGGITTVTRARGVHTLYTNGKFQGNDGWELHAQRFFAHYPSLFVKRFDRALVIGLGTGTTLGTLAAYPWEQLQVVEISPAIVEAAGTYFRGPNRDALSDPRVHVTLADGRNHLLVTRTQFDLISMELSSIWFAGASALYSREFYALVRQHLSEGGVFQQWVQLHHIYPEDFAVILRTLRAEFAHVALFFGGGQGILVASQSPLTASRAKLHALEQRSTVTEVLPDHRPLAQLVEDVLVVDSGLDRYLEDVAAAVPLPPSRLVSTDDNMWLEYRTPRGNVLPWSTREALVSDLSRYRDPRGIAAMLAP